MTLYPNNVNQNEFSQFKGQKIRKEGLPLNAGPWGFLGSPSSLLHSTWQ